MRLLPEATLWPPRISGASPAEVRYHLKGVDDPVAILMGRSDAAERAKGDPEAHWRALGYDLRRDPLVAPRQVHGVAVVSGRRIWALPQRPQADGVELYVAGVWGSLRFADCWPVILAGTFPTPWVMLLHAGFRGAVAGVLAQNLRRLLDRRGPRAREGLCVWMGPGIGPCCYPRSREDPWVKRGYALFPEAFAPLSEELVTVDIGRILCQQCDDLGVPRESLCRSPWCTACASDYFYSYRRKDLEARNFLVAPGPQKGFWWDNIL